MLSMFGLWMFGLRHFLPQLLRPLAGSRTHWFPLLLLNYTLIFTSVLLLRKSVSVVHLAGCPTCWPAAVRTPCSRHRCRSVIGSRGMIKSSWWLHVCGGVPESRLAAVAVCGGHGWGCSERSLCITLAAMAALEPETDERTDKRGKEEDNDHDDPFPVTGPPTYVSNLNIIVIYRRGAYQLP